MTKLARNEKLTFFPYGTQYHRAPTPLPDEWEGDLKEIAKAGYTHVQLRPQWRWHERARGNPVWDDLDRLFDLSARCGLRVVLKPMLETAPDWVFQELNGSRIGFHGVPLSPIAHGAYYVGGWWPCFDNPDVVLAASAFVKDMVARYQNHPALWFYNAWNEPVSRPLGQCHCEHSTRSCTNSTLIGFTLTNGATMTTGTEDKNGGGVYGSTDYPQGTYSTISNCIITGNSARSAGGGAYFYGRMFNCVVVGNSAEQGGGISYWCTVSNSTIVGNSSSYEGGGVHHCGLYNCTIASNSAVSYGGGGSGNSMFNCTIINNSVTGNGGVGGGTVYANLYECTVVSNYARGDGGGVWYVAKARNCLIIGNSAMGNGGGAYTDGVIYGIFSNCTIVGNSAATNGGGVCGAKLLNNSIVYFNNADVAGSNWSGAVNFTNSCTSPDPGGVGNITSDPMLLNPGSGYGTNHVAGNYRLSARSPCVNAGMNFSWMTDPTDARSKDLDGHSRIDRFSGIVDMGAYEYLPSGIIFRGF